jgi:hypothetical protein
MLCNNGDKVVLTEERFKTMFTIFMSELNKNKVNDIFSANTDITKTRTIKNTHQEEYNMNTEETHPAGYAR